VGETREYHSAVNEIEVINDGTEKQTAKKKGKVP
jgi:hypothetical protein